VGLGSGISIGGRGVEVGMISVGSKVEVAETMSSPEERLQPDPIRMEKSIMVIRALLIAIRHVPGIDDFYSGFSELIS
jgi:hypothetical protein